MLQLDKKTISDFENAGVKKLKVFFYEAGCSGKKIDMIADDFEITEDLIMLDQTPLQTPSSQFFSLGGEDETANGGKNAAPFSSKGERIQDGGCLEKKSFDIYIPKTDQEHLENAKITRVVVADHTGEEKTRYIFASDEVEDRCGCGTSFAFEKPVPKIDLEKLRLLRQNFKNKNI